MRTALTGIAVAWGIFMLIVLLGMSKGVVNAFDSNARNQGSNMLKIWGGVATGAYGGYKEGREIQLKAPDMSSVQRQNNHQVAGVTSEIQGTTGTFSTDHDYTSGSYQGVSPAEARQRAMEMSYGRFINDEDMEQKRKVIVLNKTTAEALFPDISNAVGQGVRFNGLVFQLIGVYDSEWNRTIYIPFTTARMLAGNSEDIGSMNVELQNVNTEEDGDKAEERTRHTLATIHDFNSDDQGAIWVWNRFTQFLKMQQGMGILSNAMWVIGLLTLLSGVIGVSNIMFVSVRERTHEIGVRRAIGAKPRSILTQIIAEGVAITTLFGYIGIVLGTAVMEVVRMFFGNTEFIKDPGVGLDTALEVTLVLILAGCLAGLFPALKALKIKPVEALREE